MRIDSVTVENYKVFLGRQSIEFAPGFNLLVGSNNSGKTTVLDVLDLNLGLNDPHRSVRTVPDYGGATSPMSQFEMEISSRYEELRRLGGWNQVFLPLAEQAMRDTIRTQADVRNFTKLDADFVMRAEFGGALRNCI